MFDLLRHVTGKSWLSGYVRSNPAMSSIVDQDTVTKSVMRDSLAIGTSGTSYQTVCGRFRVYKVGSVDAFGRCGGPVTPSTIEFPYVDGISITYESPGNRNHIFTYAAGLFESAVPFRACNCMSLCARESFIGSDLYCESSNPDNDWVGDKLYPQDVLFDGQQCTALEATCCNLPNLPWFCKTLPTPISGDLEVPICTDEFIDNENVALEFFESNTIISIVRTYVRVTHLYTRPSAYWLLGMYAYLATNRNDHLPHKRRSQ